MSTPPPAPQEDAPLPPGGGPSTPTPQFQGAAPAKGKGAKIGMIIGGVLLVGGLVFAGVMYGPGLFGKWFGGVPKTPDGTIKYVLNGIADNEPEVLWKVLPESHQKTLNENFKKALANTDEEIHQESVAVLKKIVSVLKNKKALIIELSQSASANGGPANGGPGMGGPGMGGPGMGGPGMGGPGMGGPGMGGPPAMNGPNPINIVTDNYDGILEIFEVILNSKLSDFEWIKNPDLGQLIKEDGGKLMSLSSLDELLNIALSSNRSGPTSVAQLRSALRNVEVVVVSQTDSEASVKLVSSELSPDPDQPESPEFKMVKMEDRWLPEALATDLQKAIDDIAEEMGGSELLGQGLTPQQKTASLRFLKALDGVLDAIDMAKNAEELMGAVVAGGAGLSVAASNLESAFSNFGGSPLHTGLGSDAGSSAGLPGLNPNPTPNPGTGFSGVRPPNSGTVAGANTPALPGLTPQPTVPVGRTVNWNINAGSKLRIDIIYKGKPSANVKAAFGEPDAMEGAYWVYTGMKVRNLASGGTMNTVLFLIQEDKVVQIKAR